MSFKEDFSWEYLKNVANALDSYRIRALIDAKQDILEAGIYDESQYDSILYKMLEEERLKYSLFNLLNNNTQGNLEILSKFSKENSIELHKTISLLELLKNENYILVEELFDKIKGTNAN